jgi:hypothetical protein
MTRAEIGTIFGEENGTETSRRTRTWFHAVGTPLNAWLDDDAKVFDLEFNPSTETIVDKLRRWLGTHCPDNQAHLELLLWRTPSVFSSEI